MWPKDQDEFVANHIMPDGADSSDAWYFVFIRGELVCKTVQGAPEPITADDFRWFDAEVKSKHFLGHHGSMPCFALRAAGAGARGICIDALARIVGSNIAVVVLSCRTRSTDH
jgi:hypothetical protein